MGCCANTSRKEPTCPDGRLTSSKRLPLRSTTDPARSSDGRPRRKSLPNNYTHTHSSVLQRPIELATYTANAFTALCRELGIRQSMGRVGSCFDNAAAEAFFSSLGWEVLSRNTFRDTVHAQAVVIDWCYDFYNHQRRHTAADGLSPVNYEIRETNPKPEAA